MDNKPAGPQELVGFRVNVGFIFLDPQNDGGAGSACGRLVAGDLNDPIAHLRFDPLHLGNRPLVELHDRRAQWIAQPIHCHESVCTADRHPFDLLGVNPALGKDFTSGVHGCLPPTRLCVMFHPGDARVNQRIFAIGTCDRIAIDIEQFRFASRCPYIDSQQEWCRK